MKKRVTPTDVSALRKFLKSVNVPDLDRIPKNTIGVLVNTLEDEHYLVVDGQLTSISSGRSYPNLSDDVIELVVIQEIENAKMVIRQRLHGMNQTLPDEKIRKMASFTKEHRDQNSKHTAAVVKFCRDYKII